MSAFRISSTLKKHIIWKEDTTFLLYRSFFLIIRMRDSYNLRSGQCVTAVSFALFRFQ